MIEFEPVIGLEVHAQLLTQSKMFCSCTNTFDAGVNENICPVCTGQPGSLPVTNRFAIELGIRAALAIEGTVNERSVFSRKNYFYPDLPKGYQISQYDLPFCTKGKLNVPLISGEVKKIGITRIHFEEDAGKSSHGSSGTLVNLNRAGVPLIEIVSEPDMRSSHEAGQYLRSLRAILQYAEICDGNMEEGSFRCDANVSVRPKGQEKFGTKVELKNINSFKFIEKAIDYEIKRQSELILQGGKVLQQTRSWNSAKGISELMREKEEAHDYRYFPEPDLPVLVINSAWVEEVRKALPELPSQKAERFVSGYGLSSYDAGVLTSSKQLADYYEIVAKASGNPKLAANWVTNELLGRLNASEKEISSSPVTAEHLSQLLKKLSDEELNGKMAKAVFEEMFSTGKSPESIVKEKGLVQITDPDAILKSIRTILAANPDQVSKYKAGKVQLLGFFVGQVMKATKGQANPEVVNELVKKELN